MHKDQQFSLNFEINIHFKNNLTDCSEVELLQLQNKRISQSFPIPYEVYHTMFFISFTK